VKGFIQGVSVQPSVYGLAVSPGLTGKVWINYSVPSNDGGLSLLYSFPYG